MGVIMKRFLAFITMFILFIPDIPWCLLNLVQGAVFWIAGTVMQLMGFKPFGKKVALYGRNIALSIDQFAGTKGMGQDPDVSISMALGVAKELFLKGLAKVHKFWLLFADFVNFLFGFQEDHVVEAIEREEKAAHTVIHLYTDKKPEEERKAA